MRATTEPVFYDCEASAFEGFPIEIGWAFADGPTGAVLSERHLILPADAWRIEAWWDRAAEKLHGISLRQVRAGGRPAAEIAGRMNEALRGRELFSDDPHDERWLRQLFAAGGVTPTFALSKVDAKALIATAAAERGIDPDRHERLRTRAAQLEPRRHRAEADARRLAILWSLIARDPTRPAG